jgi:8-amino-7-oxononanoate synthase
MSDRLDQWLAAAAERRTGSGLQRRLHPRQVNDTVIDVASNDYLGLATDPRVIAAAIEAIQSWGAGSTGSRLVTGTTQCHVDLENALSDFLEASACLAFSSGYAANLGVITALGGPDTLVVSDADNHASIADACRLSRSRVAVSKHGDVNAVREALASRTESRAIVAVDAVFSVDGALAPLAELHAVCSEFDADLVVDEAHALGVIGERGQGLAVQTGIAWAPDVIRTVTFSKSLGSQGGAVIASAAVVTHLLNTARTFIFDTGLAPACVGAATAALEILRANPQLAAQARERSIELASALGVPEPTAAVVSLTLGDPELTLRVADRCRAAGVLVGCFRPPSVPVGESRLRLTGRANLTDDEVRRAASTVLEAVGTLT